MSTQNNPENIQWLSLLRTINIVLVVMYHIYLIDMATGENHVFCTSITYPFHPVRMPLFIFISGGLLYVSRIKKNWSVFSLYKDKFIRIMVPFFFFVTVYFLIKALMGSIVKTPVNISLSYYLESFVLYANHSSAILWFLATLMELMLFYPVYRYACKNTFFMFVLLVISFLGYFLDISVPADKNYFNYSEINHYFFYFYFGIIFFRYSFYKYLDKSLLFLFLAVIYAIMYHFDVYLITSIIGILAIVSMVLCFSRHLSLEFSYIGSHIYQIYLMSWMFQAFVELILWKKLFYNENLVYFFYLLNLSFGLFMPLLVTRIIEKCPVRLVRICFGLK